MKVHKAVITAAGRGQRALPRQTLVDRDGSQKSSLRVILDEALSTGVEKVCVVANPGDQGAYREAAGDAAGRLDFAEQPVGREGASSSSAFCLHPSAFNAPSAFDA